MVERATPHEQPPVDPSASPWRVPAVEGIPFAKDSEEARAIERVLARADRERAAASARES